MRFEAPIVLEIFARRVGVCVVVSVADAGVEGGYMCGYVGTACRREAGYGLVEVGLYSCGVGEFGLEILHLELEVVDGLVALIDDLLGLNGFLSRSKDETFVLD